MPVGIRQSLADKPTAPSDLDLEIWSFKPRYGATFRRTRSSEVRRDQEIHRSTI